MSVWRNIERIGDASNPASEEHSAEDEVEETSLMEPKGGFLEPILDSCDHLRLGARVIQKLHDNEHLSRTDKIYGL